MSQNQIKNSARPNKFDLTLVSIAVGAIMPLIPIGKDDDPDLSINLAAIVYIERQTTPTGDALQFHMTDGLVVELTVEQTADFQRKLKVGIEQAQAIHAQQAGRKLGIIH